MDVFHAFKQTPYTFLTIKRGATLGDRITGERELMGIFKNKAGMVQTGHSELLESTSTLHVHPEDFPNMGCESLIGQGIRYNNVEYSISGATAGFNYETNTLEHYRLTLQKAVFVGGNNG